MERKAAVKMEDSIRSSLFHDHFPADKMFGLLSTPPSNEEDTNSLGFMELLGIREFPPSIFDDLQFNSPPPSPVEAFRPPTQTSAVPALSESSVYPTTPNSSISSASSGAATDEQSKAAANHEEEDEQQKTTKRLKVKRTSQKRKEKEPRFAFMTRSEVDHLEDGYRWRKYGQKAVKNSPFPRSYYRCTNSSCHVKKRVERCVGDPTIVVNTYEGRHTHSSPIMHRQTISTAAALQPTAAFNAVHDPFQPQVIVPPQSQFISSLPPFMNCGNYTSNLNPTSSALLTVDHGLLQDILPSPLRKD